MSSELVVERSPFGIRAGLLEDGRLLEVSLAEAGADDLQGNVYLGRVAAIDPQLDAAFVDCGLAEDGYLGARDARVPGMARAAPIARRLSEGQGVLVQVRRGAAAGKRPRLTMDIALVGPGLVYRPGQRGANLSARLARTTAAAEQRARARLRFPGLGITFRLAACANSDDELAAEAARLEHQWTGIQSAARAARPPACLHTVPPLHRLLLEQLTPDLGRIVADPASVAGIRAWLAEWRAPMGARLERQADPFEATAAAAQLEEALQPRVPLAAGGALIIQPTAALTAIDVDGGGRRALEANLDACREIARQLRLRRIGGTVVVDFIDLPARAERTRVVDALCRALADDPAPVQAFPASRLGLVEISRKRTGPTLAEALGRVCPVCGGDGVLVGLRRRAEELMAALAGQVPGRTAAYAAPDLHDFLSGPGAPAWRGFVERHGAVPLALDRSLDPGGHRLEEQVR